MKKLKYTMAIFICLIMAMSVFGAECASAAKNTKQNKKNFSEEVDFIGKAKIKGKLTEGIKIILLKNGEYVTSTLTDEDGKYEFKNVTKEKYQIKAEYQCYKSKTTKVNTGKRATQHVKKVINLNKKIDNCNVEKDSTAPVISLEDHPEAINTAIVTLTGTVDDETASVKINEQNATVTENTWTIDIELEEGNNTITVTTEDAAGNQAEPIVTYMVIDTIAPDTFIDNLIINGTDIEVEYHGTESVYSTKIDDNEWSEWTDSHYVNFTDLEPGEHTVYVQSMDDVGNIDLTPAMYPFTIEEPEATVVIMDIDKSANIDWHTLIWVDRFVWKAGILGTDSKTAMRFDLSSISGDTVVKSATLKLTHMSVDRSGIGTESYIYDLHEITSDWHEQINFTSQTTDVIKYMPPEYDEKIQDRYVGYTADGLGVVEFDMTNLVQKWVSGADNKGVILVTPQDEQEAWIYNVFYGNSYTDDSLTPKLVVEYY